MMDEKSNLSDVVDTTDCLEAIGAFKAMKNLFFVVTFICLIVLQGIFWLNYLGYVDVSDAPGQPSQLAQSLEIVEVDADNAPAAPVITEEVEVVANQEVSSDITIEEQAEKAVSGVSGDVQEVDTASAEEAAAIVEVDVDVEDAPPSSLAKFIPKYQHACVVIRLSNFVLVITATIYCLILLMSIKISLIGRLGGISHISRAFFLSMFALVILLPWQGLFDGIVLGAIYTPAELFTKWTLTDESTIVCKAVYFARFTGMWAISFLLLLAAQARSAKWSKTTLRRLGIIR